MLIVGASRGAADDLARQVAASGTATFGVQCLSLTQLAARTAAVALAAEGLAPGTMLGAEAVAARAVFDAREAGTLDYFEPVAGTPGFPRALARTVHELRLAAVGRDALGGLPLAGPDLRTLLRGVEDAFDAAGAADRARLFGTAASLLRQRPIVDSVILLDVPVEHRSTRALVAALLTGATRSLATVPHGDAAALAALVALGGVVDVRQETGVTSLARLRRFLFNDTEPPPAGDLDTSLELFSAPGEGRECVEIARRILAEARAGVRFDEIAIFVRSPHSYVGLLEHALHRAGVAAWFDRGTRRPHPAGRAFLSLLACAAEHLSATRFAEYLSLGQVPQCDASVSTTPDPPHVAPGDEVFGRFAAAFDAAAFEDAGPDDQDSDDQDSGDQGSGDEGDAGPGGPGAGPGADGPAVANAGDGAAVVAGTLRAPWRWERFLVDAGVIGQDAGRWRRRLDGAAAALDVQIAEAARQDGEDAPRVRGLQQAREQLGHLRGFAVPVIETLGSWPPLALWGEWLDLFERLAPRVVREPARVLRVFADLRPMAAVGPIDLDEARRVLNDRLLTLESEPPSRRFGRVFVGSPEQARGRSFRVVFVPGLAERMFPQKPREDPLLLDDLRDRLDAALPRQHERLQEERRLLQVAAQSAGDRLYASYPRIELSESRARVPSFYALDVMRAATGRVPDHEALEELARKAGQSTLNWPAPPDPSQAIDDQEHDLAVLRRLLDQDRPLARGHAHYLLKLNDALRRSVIARWARGDPRWSTHDGLIRVAPATRDALDAQRLGHRAYSLSALQKFASCPYQFLLSAVYRLQPLQQPEPLQRLDPLTRGSIFHEIQARFFRALADTGRLPVTCATLDGARAVLDETIRVVAQERHEQLAPAVERVWTDETASLARDLRAWLEHLAPDGDEWEPKYFEFSFGAVPGERDPRSVAGNVTLGDGFLLRGAVDLIEEHRQSKALRITDHKTGRRPDTIDRVIVGGGAVLQPVLYGMAVEQALGRTVETSRLFYCTSAGGFQTHAIPINDRTREAGLEVLAVVDRAIETGFLAAAPTAEACGRCDFLSVCGPDTARRVARKPQGRLADLAELRSRP